MQSNPTYAGQVRCDERDEALRALISNVDEFLKPWRTFLERVGRRTIKLDPTEIISMNDDGWEQFERAVAFFDDPTVENTAGLFATTSLPDVYEAETRTVRSPEPTTVKSLLGEDSAEVMEGLLEPEHLDSVLSASPIRDYLMGYSIAEWVDEPPSPRHKPWWRFW